MRFWRSGAGYLSVIGGGDEGGGEWGPPGSGGRQTVLRLPRQPGRRPPAIGDESDGECADPVRLP